MKFTQLNIDTPEKLYDEWCTQQKFSIVWAKIPFCKLNEEHHKSWVHLFNILKQ